MHDGYVLKDFQTKKVCGFLKNDILYDTNGKPFALIYKNIIYHMVGYPIAQFEDMKIFLNSKVIAYTDSLSFPYSLKPVKFYEPAPTFFYKKAIDSVFKNQEFKIFYLYEIRAEDLPMSPYYVCIAFFNEKEELKSFHMRSFLLSPSDDSVIERDVKIYATRVLPPLQQVTIIFLPLKSVKQVEKVFKFKIDTIQKYPLDENLWNYTRYVNDEGFLFCYPKINLFHNSSYLYGKYYRREKIKTERGEKMCIVRSDINNLPILSTHACIFNDEAYTYRYKEHLRNELLHRAGFREVSEWHLNHHFSRIGYTPWVFDLSFEEIYSYVYHYMQKQGIREFIYRHQMQVREYSEYVRKYFLNIVKQMPEPSRFSELININNDKLFFVFSLFSGPLECFYWQYDFYGVMWSHYGFFIREALVYGGERWAELKGLDTRFSQFYKGHICL